MLNGRVKGRKHEGSEQTKRTTRGTIKETEKETDNSDRKGDVCCNENWVEHERKVKREDTRTVMAEQKKYAPYNTVTSY